MGYGPWAMGLKATADDRLRSWQATASAGSGSSMAENSHENTAARPQSRADPVWNRHQIGARLSPMRRVASRRDFCRVALGSAALAACAPRILAQGHADSTFPLHVNWTPA